ncbi:MAG TPA: hypothetical protein VG076_14595 [Acidimicrobiales bacterium]|nr:hypothetical protein [Acidimicrobiales bacterium]
MAPPGATRWDDFHVFNQGPGVDVAAAEAVDGSGAIAFYAFSSDSEAQGFVRDPPPHLAGIGDYNALQALPPSAGLPAGASVADLRTCSGSATGVATGTGVAACTGSTHSSGVITVVPLGNFALVTAAWSTTPGEASGETTDRAVREAGEALTFWAGTPK